MVRCWTWVACGKKGLTKQKCRVKADHASFALVSAKEAEARIKNEDNNPDDEQTSV